MKFAERLKFVELLGVVQHAQSLLAVLSAGINLLTYLFVMRLVFNSYGLNAIGLWSLVMALSSVLSVITFVTLVLSFIYYGLMFADWGN